MKRIILSIAIILSVIPIHASVAFGYSLSMVGEKSPIDTPFGALSASMVFSPWKETHVLDFEGEVLLSPVDPYFNGVNMKVSSPIFLSRYNPFSFMFPNSVYWSPRLSLGAQYRMDSEWNLYLGISPLSFQDTGYIYEFFSPYALYNISDNSWGYGMYIMRFSVFFGGAS